MAHLAQHTACACLCQLPGAMGPLGSGLSSALAPSSNERSQVRNLLC